MTATEYLAMERAAVTRSEFYRGEVFAMAGTSREHSLIATNTATALNNALGARPCEVHGSDLRVKVDSTGLYTYPDVTIVCGTARFEDKHADTLLNPTLVVEVLSDSTERYDRGTKSAQYRSLGSLREYVLISQDRVSVEVYTRQSDGNWLFREVSGAHASVSLLSIGVEIPVAAIYRRVEWFEALSSGSSPEGA